MLPEEWLPEMMAKSALKKCGKMNLVTLTLEHSHFKSTREESDSQFKISTMPTWNTRKGKTTVTLKFQTEMFKLQGAQPRIMAILKVELILSLTKVRSKSWMLSMLLTRMELHSNTINSVIVHLEDACLTYIETT
jgi:hypothetical protein